MSATPKHPGLAECLFNEGAQHHILERVIHFVESKGVVTALPLYGEIPGQDHSFNETGHQTSLNFLKDHSPSNVDTLRFDLLASDMKDALHKKDPLFCTWMVHHPICSRIRAHSPRAHGTVVGAMGAVRIAADPGQCDCKHTAQLGNSIF